MGTIREGHTYDIDFVAIHLKKCHREERKDDECH